MRRGAHVVKRLQANDIAAFVGRTCSCASSQSARRRRLLHDRANVVWLRIARVVNEAQRASDAQVRAAFFFRYRLPEIAMRSLRSLASLAPIIAAVGCASLPARQPAPASGITFDHAASPAQAR